MHGFRIDRDEETFNFRLPNNVPVEIHWSVVVVPFLLFLPKVTDGLIYVFHLLAFTMVLVISILLHEIAHMREARRHGVKTDLIYVYMFGGLAILDIGDGRVPYWRIALAGPVMNMALAGAFVLAWASLPNEPPPAGFSPELQALLQPRPGFLKAAMWYAFLLNAALAAVNLLPAYPLDGGAVAETFLERRFGYRRANLIVGISGLIFATLSTVITIVLLPIGYLVWAPPAFAPNFEPVSEAWKRWRRRRKDKQAGATAELAAPLEPHPADYEQRYGKQVAQIIRLAEMRARETDRKAGNDNEET